MEDVQTSWGLLPRWKARALALAEIQTVVDAMPRDDGVTIRNDSAGASQLSEEYKSPPLAADAEEKPPPREPIPPEVLAAIEQKIQQLTDRLDAYERMQKANAALDDLEAEMERLYPPSAQDVELLN
jgi:hypothetical protein